MTDKVKRVYVARRGFDCEPKRFRDNWLTNRGSLAHSALLVETEDGSYHIVQYGGSPDIHNITVQKINDFKLINKYTDKSYETFEGNGYLWTKQLKGQKPQNGEWTLTKIKNTMEQFDKSSKPPTYNLSNFLQSKVCHKAQLFMRKAMGIANLNETYSIFQDIGNIANYIQNKGKEYIKKLVGGVELSLNDLDLDNLYGFNFDRTNKTLIALCKKGNNNNNDSNENEEKISNDNDDEADLSDNDSILKKSDNNRSIMVWQHFCIFLKMFHDDGDRESISFSLDPDEKIERNKSNGNVRMKKVYYPEHLRWAKAGEVMFDADLFIKTLLYDLHPDITKHIPNYQSYIQNTLNNINWDDDDTDNQGHTNWHRLWIVLDEIEQSEDDNSFIINKIKFKINARKMNVNHDGELHDDVGENEDELLTQFVEHMNKNMDVIHEHSLFLQRLEGVFRALILAKFAYNNNIPFNMDIIDEVCNQQKEELNNYGITFTLPSMVKTVSKHREINNGDHIIRKTRANTFCGGIELNMKLNITKPTTLGSSGESLIKIFESGNAAKFESKAYLCPAGVATIGWGHTKGITQKDIENGITIDREQAQKYFEEDIAKFEQCINENVNKDITQNQYDALLSLTFNIGCDAFKNSTLLKELNAGNYEKAAEQFDVWNKVTVNGKKVISKGLVNRRRNERELFERMDCDNDNEVKKKLKSVKKVFNQINESINSMQDEFEQNRVRFEKLCDIKNKDEQYTVILFPNILFDKKGEMLCEDDECKQFISWQKSHIFEDKKYCKNHYDTKRYSKCIKCEDNIDKLYDKYRIMESSNNKQLILHSTCCVCYFCNKILNENICLDTRNGFGLFCSNTCFKKSVGFTEDNTIKKCIKCQSDIDVLNELNIVQTGNGDVLHSECLKCDECGKSLKGGSIMDDKNNIFCDKMCANKKVMKSLLNNNNNDNEETAIICSKCRKNIDLLAGDGYIKMADNMFIHPSCLKCDECHQLITNGNTIIDNKNNMFCNKICANKKMMRRVNKNNNNNKSISCHKCKKDIILTKQGFITMGNDMLLHPKCAICYQCHKSLTSLVTGVVMDNDKNMFCSSDCGNQYHQNQ